MSNEENELQIIKQFEPAIFKAAHNATRNNVCCFEDLVQEGRIATLIAYRQFDPNRIKGQRLEAYIKRYIRYYMLEYQKNHISSMSHTAYSTQLLRDVKKEMKNKGIDPELKSPYDYLMELGREKEAKKIAALDNGNLYEDSLDASDDNFISFNPYNSIEDTDSNLMVESLLNKCSPIQREVICLRTGIDGQSEGLSFIEISKKMHISHTTAVSLFKTGAEVIKKALRREDGVNTPSPIDSSSLHPPETKVLL